MSALRVLSLGAGVQSTTLALMAVEGTLPKPDYAIFADTQCEPGRVYRHLDKLTAVLGDARIPVLRVTEGNLAADAIDPAGRFAAIPYYTSSPPAPCDRCRATGRVPGEAGGAPAKCGKCRGTGRWDGKGMGQRQCTPKYKLRKIRQKERELLGAPGPEFLRVPKGRVCEEWVGFSADEIGRVNDRSPGYIAQRYPLMDLGMDRGDCRRWLRLRGWAEVAKSACIMCPYLGNEEWRDMRDNRPAEWAAACAFDEAIRHGGGNPTPPGTTAYLHASRVPLAGAPVDKVTWVEWKSRQGDIFDAITDIAIEKGNPDGCSPHGCRSGEAVA